MTTREKIEELLPIELEELRQILRDHGVVSARLFGSFARGEAGPDSDLDLLVTGEPGRSIDIGTLQYDLSERIGRQVELATKLNKHFAPYIDPELITVL